MIHIDLSKDLEAHIRAVSENSDRSLEEHVQAALVRYFEDLEDVILAEERLDALEAGTETTIPMEEMMARLGLAR